MQSDADLVMAVCAGDKHAYETLVGRYEHSVRAAALAVLGDRHLADDVVQEAFIKAYVKLPKLQRPTAFYSWLIRIARNLALDALRMKKKETYIELSNIEIKSRDDDNEFDQNKRYLLTAVTKLPEAEKQAVMLYYFDGHNIRDVAGLAGRSVGTITKQLSRARNRLRNMLTKMEI